MRLTIHKWGVVLVSACLVSLATSRNLLAVEILDDPDHYARLSATAMQTANVFCWELHRYHQQQPDFPALYRDAKEIWNQAANLNNALQAGPVDAATANQQVARMSTLVASVEKGISKWGDGVRPTPPDVMERPRVVMTPGYGVNIPFFGGVRFGSRVAIAEEVAVPTPANRRAMHPNGPGSRRTLDREMAAVKNAVGYLAEDIAIPAVPAPPPATPVPANEPPAPAATPVPSPPRPVPQPAVPESAIPDTTAKPDEGTVQKVNPASARKTEPPTAKK